MFWIGLAVVFLLGVAVIAYGAWSDGRRRRRLHEPPPIPGVADQPRPSYLTADEVSTPAPPDATAQAALAEAVRQQPQATELRGRLETTAAITGGDPQHPWAVLEAPTVLVLTDAPTLPRELVPTLSRFRHRALLVVSPGLPDELIELLEVNTRHSGLPAAAAALDEEPLTRLADLTGATAVTRAQLQADYLPSTRLGHADRVALTGDTLLLWDFSGNSQPSVSSET